MNSQDKSFHIAHHQAMAEHAAACAKAESQCADSHTALAEHHAMTAPEVSKHHSDLAEAHRDKAGSFVTAGENHLACCKSLEAMGTSGEKVDSGDLQKLLAGVTRLLEQNSLPNGFSIIPRTDAPRGSLVTRAGQPSLSDHQSAKDAIDPALRNIVFDDRQARD